MKKPQQIFSLFGISLISLVACDSGELIFDKLNFNNLEVKNCKTIYYKISKNELLLVNLDNGSGLIALDTLTPIGETRSIAVNNTNSIVYRTYSDNIADNVICSVIPPATPVVISEYIANSGGKINYTPIVETGFVNARATINYLFKVNFQNIVLSNSSENIKYELYDFGSILFKSNAMPFYFTQPISYCENELRFLNNLSQNTNGITSYELIFNKNDIFSQTQTAGEKTFSINANNSLEYKLYSGAITEQEPCANKTNSVKESWIAKEGNLVVNTVISPINGTAQRTYSLKNVIFRKNNHQFVVEDLVIKTE